ncbi:MAG: FAD-binding oxidoreductase [Caldilinea sp. CFX5]|nr:FAD-binding oxidoreductase [Caldilinea sp. CFX5]
MMNRDWIADLRTLLGAAHVFTDDEALQQHSYDQWPVATKWRQQGKQPCRPAVVVRAPTVDAICQLLRWANQQGIPVTPWGAGSAVTGAPLPLHGGISLDLTALNQVVALDPLNLTVTVQAGKLGHELEQELNAHGYTLNHSPQSLNRSTVGGWVATRATGQFSSRWGGIEDLVVALTIVLPTGALVQTKVAPRAAIGPELRHLFIGAEGTLGVVTAVTLKIFPLAPYQRLEALVFPDVASGLTAMRQIMQADLRPFLVRFYDEDEAAHAMQEPTFSRCVLFLGFAGIEAVAQAEYAASLAFCRAAGGEPLGPAPVTAWLARRFDFSSVERVLARPGGVAETIEVAHFWSGILDTYRALKTALAPLATHVWGHFSHVYPQGASLYMILIGEVADAAAAEARLHEIWEVSMRTALQQGAVISHHHGVGLARLPYLSADLGTTAPLLAQVKAALDPSNIMNPGKLGFAPLQQAGR